MHQASLYGIALTCIPRLSRKQALDLFRMAGNDASVYFELSSLELKERFPEMSETAITLLSEHRSAALARAEKESAFIEKHQIQSLLYGQDVYPHRLTQCNDAPLVLYYKGNADLNATYAVGMVGTRKCTEYGKDMCRGIISGLSAVRKDTLVVSGLAYGIDIHCHKGAMDNSMATVAVLAHGLDRIYPAAHRDIARKMCANGGVLTEYMSETIPEKGNFLSRNRIIAGMTDACIVVESASQGGSLVTARIAQGYGRDVLAVPGRATDRRSEGCNMLIRENVAALVTNAEDILYALNWPSQQVEEEARSLPKEQDLFLQFTPDEQTILSLLENCEGKQINQLVVESNMPVGAISAILFELEMKGVVRLIAGGRYHLISS